MNSYNLPVLLKIERDALLKLFYFLDQNNIKFKKAILITDEIIYDKYRLLIEKVFKNHADQIQFYKIEDNSIKTAINLSERIIEDEIDCVFGFGGGKVLDIAKYASFISKRIYISIPTAIAHDGIASPIAVLKSKNGFSKSLGAKIPDAILIDIKVLSECPIRLIEAGIGDTLSNYTAIYDWKIAGRANKVKLNDFSILLSDLSFNSLFRMKKTEITSDEFLIQLSESIVLSGMAMEIAGTSRPCSGSEHLFSHAIDTYLNKSNLHGIQVALGAVVSAFLQKRNYVKLIDFLKTYKICIKPSALDISWDDFLLAWKNGKTTRTDRYTILDEITDLEEKLLSIYNIIENQ